MKSLGIIGGVGPETTAEFYLNIIFSCQKQNHLARPNIIIASVPLPYQLESDLITKNKNSDELIPFLVNEAK
jgi:aspartate racemase